ncbi:SIS domain-containing protein [Novosphingobium sp. FSW06-99]|uniref:SIS domain-containing protein n=1 Tax=Novosphingobium sp. FSW06-99 TaxID=1739113 RepID=UPI00076D7014|nr:iron dicitrate transport regulator FecR [Novosphingobium sp. FSW06-99]
MVAERGTVMAREAAEAPARVAQQWRDGGAAIRALAARLRADPPRAVVTIARGSSDNAATYARYLIETRLEVLTASLAPSTASVFTAQPDMAGVLALAISQSGRSPDLIAAARAARDGGALLVVLVNDTASPLAAMADVVIPLDAGPELAVAATKSFITALSAIAALVACWSGDDAMLAAVEALPQQLEAAWHSDWQHFVDALADAVGLYVLGRGPGFAAAQEAALKLKETCGLHAEAFSAAEVRHGPMALIHSGFPVIAFVPDDAGREGVDAAIAAARAQGATMLEVGGVDPSGPAIPRTHPALTPIVQIQGFYRLVDALAARRGYDPDSPPHLAKVTSTR